MTSTEVIALLRKAGWYEVDCSGDHHQFKHPERPGRVTVPHPKKDLPAGTLSSIRRQSGLKLR